LAARYRFSPRQIAAATASVRLRHPDATAGDHGAALAAACRAVSMQRAAEFAQVIVPKRRPDQLILPPMLHRRVIEVAEFFRHQAQVDEAWGFGRLLSGAGMKVLMTGDSGTGKTAAAEVIAGQVATDQLLLKVNLAGVVSKWVGETERNLDAVFTHAEESHAALFFDEADALFAKRGEVDRGADRYANLEVGFLLQRLEEFGGLAILASNHKDQLDEAFMRRFQVILHFPRPGIEERRKLWALALPPEAPLEREVDLSVFDALDLTGAGIVNAARLAGLLAAGDGAKAIGMEHLVAAVVRQFQNEARLLTPSQLGEFAHLATSSA
jgi:SpoVK/Ycf46/Vps4 family AAA+-type ATPase